MAPKGPYKLCTVNTVPERAKLVVGRVVDALKERYTVIHVENAESMLSYRSRLYIQIRGSSKFQLRMYFPSAVRADANFNIGIEDVKAMCERSRPDLLVTHFPLAFPSYLLTLFIPYMCFQVPRLSAT